MKSLDWRAQLNSLQALILQSWFLSQETNYLLFKANMRLQGSFVYWRRREEQQSRLCGRPLKGASLHEEGLKAQPSVPSL